MMWKFYFLDWVYDIDDDWDILIESTYIPEIIQQLYIHLQIKYNPDANGYASSFSHRIRAILLYIRNYSLSPFTVSSVSL